MSTQVSNPVVMVNNVQVAVTPNSVKYTEGLGEQKIRAASTGGDQVEQVYSEDVESNFSTVNFDMPATIDNIANQRAWKVNKNANVIQIMGSTPEGSVTRTFTQAALLNDTEVALGSETDISLEFKANQAI
jgi:hypothetical protein